MNILMALTRRGQDPSASQHLSDPQQASLPSLSAALQSLIPEAGTYADRRGIDYVLRMSQFILTYLGQYLDPENHNNWVCEAEAQAALSALWARLCSDTCYDPRLTPALDDVDLDEIWNIAKCHSNELMLADSMSIATAQIKEHWMRWLIKGATHKNVDPAGKLRIVLDEMTGEQPVFEFGPSNFFEQREEVGSSLGLLPDLTRALLGVPNDWKAVTLVILEFFRIAKLAVRLKNGEGEGPNLALSQRLFAGAAEQWGLMCGDRLSNKPLAVRRALAQVNLRGCTQIMYVLANELGKIYTSNTDLEEALQAWILRNLLEKQSSVPTQTVQVMVEYLSLGHILDMNLIQADTEELDNECHNPDDDENETVSLFEFSGYTADEEEDEDEDEFDLVEVEYEPIGPRIDLNDSKIADPYTSVNEEEACSICCDGVKGALAVQLKHCQHMFHHVCIDEWLNGCADNSNLCPNCRHQVCERRARRPKSSAADEVEGDTHFV